MDFEQLLGAGVMLLFLADIFFTVLYARAGTGLLAFRWNRLVWAALSAASRLSSRYRSTILSFAGPKIVVSLIAFWALGLTLGAALIVHPELVHRSGRATATLRQILRPPCWSPATAFRSLEAVIIHPTRPELAFCFSSIPLLVRRCCHWC